MTIHEDIRTIKNTNVYPSTDLRAFSGPGITGRWPRLGQLRMDNSPCPQRGLTARQGREKLRDQTQIATVGV